MSLTEGSTVTMRFGSRVGIVVTALSLRFDSLTAALELWDGRRHVVRVWSGDVVQVASGRRELFELRVLEVEAGVAFVEARSLLRQGRLRVPLPRLRAASVRRVPDPRRVLAMPEGGE